MYQFNIIIISNNYTQVLGKLTFASAAGYMVDVCGYMLMFLVFVILSVAVIPLFKYYPFDLRDDVFPVIEEYKGKSNIPHLSLEFVHNLNCGGT